MVAPGLDGPDPDLPDLFEQQQVSKRLWEHMAFKPIEGAPASRMHTDHTPHSGRMQADHTPHSRLEGMCPGTQELWGHIGQDESINRHTSPTSRGVQKTFIRWKKR